MDRLKQTGGKTMYGLLTIVWFITAFLVGFMLWMWLT